MKFKDAVLTDKVMHRTLNHLPSWPTYLVAEISNPLASAASFNHRYVVLPLAAELSRLLALSSGTLYRQR